MKYVYKYKKNDDVIMAKNDSQCQKVVDSGNEKKNFYYYYYYSEYKTFHH